MAGFGEPHPFWPQSSGLVFVSLKDIAMTDWKAVQARLTALGYKPGPVDGILGRRTIAAVAKFQVDRGIDVKWPGTVGAKTLAALDLHAPPVSAAVPVWIEEARRFLGLHEVRDAKKLDKALRLDSSAIPWCGAFVAMVVGAVLPKEGQPTNPLWALNWQKFGRAIDIPAVGAVVTFKRNGGGHVGFVVGHDATYWHVLGGNQSNTVSVAKIAKSRQSGPLRWPVTAELPVAALPHSTINASITTNEA